MTKKYYCTLDTETIGGVISPDGFYHLGGIIHDRNGSIVGCFNYLVSEWFNEMLTDDYAKNKVEQYNTMLINGDATLIDTEENAIAMVNNLLNLYNVDTLLAYNSGFDFTKTKCKELIADRNFIDLWLMAVETICQKTSFKNFCQNNGKVTQYGRCKTNAQTLYAFITDDPHYKEEHTALEDSIIELEIFKACIKTHKPYTQNEHMNDISNWYLRIPKVKRKQTL